MSCVFSLHVFSNEESVRCLQECSDCTNWNMFVKACGGDLDELADVTCSYSAFCRDMIIPCKRVKIYPNNKIHSSTQRVKSTGISDSVT